MGKFIITAPDGKSFEVTAPDGASQDEVLEFAKSHWSKAAASKPVKQDAPVDDPGAMESLAIGAGRTFDRIGKGMQQLYYGATGNEAKLQGLKATADEESRLYAPLQKARPFSTGIGEALPSMVVPAGGSATLLGNVGRMAVAGGLPGALEYGSAKERLTNASLGAVAGAAVPLAGVGAKTAGSLIEPLYQRGRDAIAGRLLNRVAGDSASQVKSALSSASELVPGSAPTAAQVAGSGGIAALERSAAAANPEAYTQRAMEQASARINALRSIAKDESALAAGKAARKSATEAMYEAADVGVAPIDGFFKGLQARPQFKSAVSRAQELAKDKGLSDIFFRDAKGNPTALIGEGAHFIKKALDEAAEFGSKSYTSKTAADSAGKTNEMFQAWLEKSIPEYAQAKTTYAAMSKPVNQMEIGQELLNKVQPALADFGGLGRESAATFAKALRDADATAAKATGLSGAKMRSVMAPDQMALIEGVAKDLARKANAQDLGRGVGSDTFQKLAMQNIAEQSGMPRLVSGLLDLPGVSRATSWAYRDTDQKIQQQLADALLNPKKAAELMSKADKKWLANNPGTRRLLEQSIVRGGGLLGMAATEPAIQ